MQLVDAHCHFDFPAFEGRRDEVWAKARRTGISDLVIPGVRAPDWPRVQRVADQSERWWYCLGIHPWFVDEHDGASLDELEAALRQAGRKCVGLGECGLDRLHGELDRQMPWFEAQVELAGRLGLPLVIHSVRTHDEVVAVPRRRRPDVPLLVHAFAGSYQQGRALMDLGCFLGVGGTVTHDRARKTRDALARLPAEQMVLETDAPDMPLAGVAKGDNEPGNLRKILTALAQLKQQDEARLAARLLLHVGRLYRWRDE